MTALWSYPKSSFSKVNLPDDWPNILFKIRSLRYQSESMVEL